MTFLSRCVSCHSDARGIATRASFRAANIGDFSSPLIQEINLAVLFEQPHSISKRAGNEMFLTDPFAKRILLFNLQEL
jgi:hypothetical protein